jgi:hypothetical protein
MFFENLMIIIVSAAFFLLGLSSFCGIAMLFMSIFTGKVRLEHIGFIAASFGSLLSFLGLSIIWLYLTRGLISRAFIILSNN